MDLIMLVWSVGFVSWFLSLGEDGLVLAFWPPAFRFGIRVWQVSMALPPPVVIGDSPMETQTGKLKLIASGTGLFRRKRRVFAFEVHTPFEVKGVIQWDGDVAHVEGRIPVFTSVFFGAWLLLWTFGGLVLALSGAGFSEAGVALLLGWVLVVGMVGFSIPFEIRRARRILQEYEHAASS